MKITKEGKKEVVEKLKEKLAKASSVVLTDYHGLSVPQMQELKNELKALEAEFSVVKNTLLSRAARQAGKALPSEELKGPTAAFFSFKDPIEGIKKLFEFIKKYELPAVKAGLFESKVLDKEAIVALSKIPSRNELYARVVGSLNSPIYGIVGVLNANLRNLVYTIDQIKNQKSK